MTKKELKEKEKNKAREHLRDLIDKNKINTIYTVLKHVSRSGMFRVIELIIIIDNEPINITWQACTAMGYKYNENHEGMEISGSGMDMGFAAVYNLSRTLYQDGFQCYGEKCRSNDHRNGDRNYTPHHHKDGGYRLSQRWL